MKYTPDRWVILEIKHQDEVHYKVLGSWYGGYTGADSWRLNSGITAAHKTEDGTFHVYGYSGSMYTCRQNTYGTSSYTAGVVDSWKRLRPDQYLTVLSEKDAKTFLDDLARVAA